MLKEQEFRAKYKLRILQQTVRYEHPQPFDRSRQKWAPYAENTNKIHFELFVEKIKINGFVGIEHTHISLPKFMTEMIHQRDSCTVAS